MNCGVVIHGIGIRYEPLGFLIGLFLLDREWECEMNTENKNRVSLS